MMMVKSAQRRNRVAKELFIFIFLNIALNATLIATFQAIVLDEIFTGFSPWARSSESHVRIYKLDVKKLRKLL